MPDRVAIRRLELRGLAPRDHPAPGELRQRLVDAAQKFLPDAIEQAASRWSGEAVLRIRRLEVDITLDAAFEPQSFAAVLAGAIVRELRRAEQTGSADGGGDGVVCYASRAIYLAALLEALAEGRAADQWWLRDAEGLRFLSRSQAIRTAMVAEPRVGLEALASLPLLRRMTVLHALTPAEAGRILDEIVRADRGSASLEQCAETVAEAAAELPDGASALAIFVAAFARKPVLAGAALVAAARLRAEIGHAPGDDAAGRTGSSFAQEHDATSSAPADDAQRMRHVPADTARRHSPARAEPAYRFTPFGGLLLLLPDLAFADIASVVTTWPDAPADAAALIGHAALGLCAGRRRLAEYLGDGLWRELFGLDARASASAMAARLGAIPDERWTAVAPLLAPLRGPGDARFLLAPRSLVGSRAATRALAGIARAASARFARHLPGFGDASASFLWTSLLATTAALERHPGGWSARLSRPPLDVLLSLARIAEGSVVAPSGARVDFARVPS
jgi:hypothetical protein